MTALTAAQIATGAKNARKIEAPKTDQDRPGRWRCWLCRTQRWRRGHPTRITPALPRHPL